MSKPLIPIRLLALDGSTVCVLNGPDKALIRMQGPGFDDRWFQRSTTRDDDGRYVFEELRPELITQEKSNVRH